MKPFEDRFWPRVHKTENCWLWLGACTSKGYGQIHKDGKSRYVHRLSFEMHKGPIPDGTEIDHICRVPSCLNPNHLEAVTHQENMQRAPKEQFGANRHKTHCIRGHPFSGQNLKIGKNSTRICVECRRIRNRKSKAKARGQS